LIEADFNLNRRSLGDAGGFSGPPPNRQIECVCESIVACLPNFVSYVHSEKIHNENGLNRNLSLLLEHWFRLKNLPFLAQPESMEDDRCGSSPAPDIGIYYMLCDSAIDLPKVTVIEGKRLDSGIKKQRRREYVYGREEKGRHVCCGGMERFKKRIHGRNQSSAILLGYMQTDSFEEWHTKINSWISELIGQAHEPNWLMSEQLPLMTIDGLSAKCESQLCRTTGALHLVHLWVDLVG